MQSRLLAILLLGLVAAGALISPGQPASATFGFTTTTLDTGDYLVPNRGQPASIALDAAGNPVVSYFDDAGAALKVLHCGDPTCTSGNTIITPASGVPTSLVLDASGYPVITYLNETGPFRNLNLLHCGDSNCSSGNTITQIDTIIGGASLVLDADGYPAISYYDKRATARDLKVLHCGDPTCTAGNPSVTPDSAGDVGSTSSIALDSAGRPVVSYFDQTNSDLKILHCGDANCVAGNTIATPDTAGSAGANSSLALDSAGRPVVSYNDAFNDDLKVLRCGDASCLSGNTITTPETGSFGQNATSIALDGADRPVVSHYDHINQDLRVLRCGDATCTSGNTASSPGGPERIKRNSSLVLDGADNPVVVYQISFGSVIGGPTCICDLVVLICGDPTCGTGNTLVSPDTSPGSQEDGDVGRHNSIVLDASGNPVIAYWAVRSGSEEASVSNLRVIHCGSADCTSGNTIAEPDTVGSVGSRPSLALDSAGRPVVSYRGTDRVLKILRCGDPACLSANVITTFASEVVDTSTSLALDASDNPVVAYSETANGDLRVLHCGDPTCTSGNSITSPDTGVGRASLALDSAGNPIIAYTKEDISQPGFEDVGIVHCGDPDCSAGNTYGLIDVSGINPSGTSMALDPDGNPVIAFYDPTVIQGVSHLLTIVHCTDPACAGSPSHVHPAPEHTAVNSISLAIRMDGRPVVTYIQASTLQLLRCGDPNCGAGNANLAFGSAGLETSIVLNEKSVPFVSYYEPARENLELLCCGAPLGPTDSDQDGCVDVNEGNANENFGGQRDNLYFWDFYDVWTHPPGDPIGWERNRVVNIFDINGVGARFGTGPVLSEADALAQALVPPTDATSYHPAFDRGAIIGANEWDRAPADGSINIVDDILGVAQQFGHDCS